MLFPNLKKEIICADKMKTVWNPDPIIKNKGVCK